jgi:hypothetical protein
MERERWLELYGLAMNLGKHSLAGSVYSTSAIVAVYLWSVVMDRPAGWACKVGNWPADLYSKYIRRLPHQSTLSRRLRSVPVLQLLERMEHALRDRDASPAKLVKIIDAKPLPTGGYSKDPDARWGRGANGQAKGYKFFAIWGLGQLPVVWRLASMNISEQNMAKSMLPELRPGGYLLGDSLYDSNILHDLAAAQGYQLVAPKQRPDAKGLGHRRHSPHRLRCFELLETPFGRDLKKSRTAIERCFGNLTSFGGGLSPLPHWIRTPHRVILWVHAKLLINAIRIEGLHPKLSVA